MFPIFNYKKIIIKRDKGGLGDIFMHRMLFEDIKKKQVPHLTFACPQEYHSAVIDHPYIDNIVGLDFDPKQYDLLLNTSFVCNRYEMRTAPFIDKHRSDIWAEHCGVNLTSHEMHIHLTEEEKAWARKQLPDNSIIFAPISAMAGKNLDIKVIKEIVDTLSNVFILHNKLLKLNVPQFPNCNIRQFMALIDASDYVISVDSAALHCAGGLRKPTVGIFSFVDGLVYCKYYPTIRLVQKHRDLTPGWTCGPCYDYTKCPKLLDIRYPRKPCITEITAKDILHEFEKLVINNT